MKNTTWDRILPGEIVNFTYKSKNENRGTRRWVICLDPKYTYRKKNGRTTKFFVGIQIDQSGGTKLSHPVITEIITSLGGMASKRDNTGRRTGIQLDIDIEESTADSGTVDLSPESFLKVYNRLKHIFGRVSVFRTYNLRECKKRRVFLEDKYDHIPKENIRQFNKEIKLGTEVVIED